MAQAVDWGGFGDVCMEVIGEKGSLYLDYRPMTLVGVDDEGWKFPDTPLAADARRSGR